MDLKKQAKIELHCCLQPYTLYPLSRSSSFRSWNNVRSRERINLDVLTFTKAYCSVPAGPISEGAAPCPYWLAPCPICTRSARIEKNKNKIALFLRNVILFVCFQTADVKMLVKCLQICAHVFINRPQDQILVVHA